MSILAEAAKNYESILYNYPPFLCLVMLLVLGVVPEQSALAANTLQLIHAAVERYDQGDFDGAITLLEEALDQEPRNGSAAYELALSHHAKGDLQACAKTANKYLRRLRKDSNQKALLPQLSMLQASCYSGAGNARMALKVFRTALRQNPDNYGLNFNIAITLINEGESLNVITHLEKAIRADPSHPSPYYVIGGVYQRLGRSVEGLLAYFAFLQREFNTSRCEPAAEAVVDIVYSQVSSVGAGEVTIITLGPVLKSDPSEIGVLTFALALMAVASAPDEEIKEPVAESISEILTRFISIGAALDVKSDPGSFFASYLLPSVIDLEKAGVSSAFSYFVLGSIGVTGAGEWIDSHQQETDELVEHFEILANRGLLGE